MRRWMKLVLLLVFSLGGCVYSGPVVTNITPGPNNTLNVTRASIGTIPFVSNWFLLGLYDIKWLSSPHTTQVAMPGHGPIRPRPGTR